MVACIYFIIISFLNRYTKEYPSATLYNIELLKDFVKNIVYGINSAKNNLKAALATVS